MKSSLNITSIIRLAVLALLVLWAFFIVTPSIGALTWALILAVAIYPFFQKLVNKAGEKRKKMVTTKIPGRFFDSAIAFYSIVHFDYTQIKFAFKEIKRVLTNNGQVLFGFRVGDIIVHLDNFLDYQIEIDFYCFEVTKIKNILEETGFEIVDIIVREPYKDVEHKSERVYIWTKKVE